MTTKVSKAMAAWDPVDNVRCVSSIAAMKTVDPTLVDAVILNVPRKEGIFTKRDYADMSGETDAAADAGLLIRSSVDTAKVWAAPLHKEILMTELGADPTAVNVSATDAAFTAALEISRLRGYLPIIFTPGKYAMAGTYSGLGPVPIRGVDQGSSGGSAPFRGVNIRHRSNGNFLSFNGGADAAAGTGGCLEQIWVQKEAGFGGGVCVTLTGVDDNHRAGEFEFRDVLTGTSGGGWDRIVYVDGTMLDTPGGRGIRTITFDNCRFTGCAVDNMTVHLRQATHVKGFIICEPASGLGLAGITIEDYTQNVDLHIRECNVIVGVGAETPGHMTFYGKINDLSILKAGIVGRSYALITGTTTNDSGGTFVVV